MEIKEKVETERNGGETARDAALQHQKTSPRLVSVASQCGGLRCQPAS